MISVLQDGDHVVFTNSREADRVERACRDKGTRIVAHVLSISSPEKIYEFSHARHVENLIFDHSWLEEMYRRAVLETMRRINDAERRFQPNAPRPKVIRSMQWPDWEIKG